MSTTAANVSHFSFLPSQLNPETFQVVRFEGTEALSESFSFRIVLVSESANIDFSKLVNQPATLTVDRGGKAVPFCGLVTQIEQKGRTSDYVCYEVVVRPRVWRLSLTKQSRIFQNVTTEEIVTEVLKGAGFAPKDFQFELSGTYAPREYCVQYQESDLNFVRRLLEFEGIAFYFTHGDDGDVMVMTDDRSAHTKIDGETTLRYAEGSGLNRDAPEHVESFTYREEITPKSVVLKDYNPETPETGLQVEATASDDMDGEVYEYAGKYADADQGTRLATVRAEARACRRKTFRGLSDSAGLKSGYLFSLEAHYRDDLNEDYLVVEVEHTGSQQQALGLSGLDLPGMKPYGAHPVAGGDGAASDSVYRNEFRCIPATVQFRPKRKTPEPQIPGIMTAKIETAGGEYAYIDDQGRYRAKMHFDRSDRGEGTATKPIRMATPNSGPDYGIHFPNHAGAEMIVAHVNGDVDRPLALGTVPNPNQQSPAISENRMQNVIRTFGGNELLMDDTTEEARIHLQSAEKHELVMDDKEDRVQVITTGQHTILLDDKNERIEIQSTKGRKVLLDDKNEIMSVVSETGHHLDVSDKDDAVTVADAEGKHVLTLDYENETMSLVTEGDIGLEASGAVEIKGQSVLIESEKDTTIDAGGNLTQSAGKDATIDASGDATLTAGKNLTAKGGKKADLTAMDVTVEGSKSLTASGKTQAELSGMNLTVEGTGMAEIKSAMLKVNG